MLVGGHFSAATTHTRLSVCMDTASRLPELQFSDDGLLLSVTISSS